MTFSIDPGSSALQLADDLLPDGVEILIARESAFKLRAHLGFVDSPLAGPAPRFVTRVNASLDNFCAELLLRACYAPANDLAPIEEHRLYESRGVLRIADNPALRRAVLIGIGGLSEHTEAIAVYDEHATGGKRREGSTTKLVYDRHVVPNALASSLDSVAPVVNEINTTDAHGGASGDHLYSILKVVHAIRWPDNIGTRSLSMARKRAVVGGTLTAILIDSARDDAFDNSGALERLIDEWQRFLEATRGLRACGRLPNIDDAVVSRVHTTLARIEQATIGNRKSTLTLRRAAASIWRAWTPNIASSLLRVYFEALLQAQQAFDVVLRKPLHITPVRDGYVVLSHRVAPDEILPHRALQVRMRTEAMRGIVVVSNPSIKSTMAVKGHGLSSDCWARFVKLLLAAEPQDTWYVPTADDGTVAVFVLNRTESFVGAPQTRLRAKDFANLLSRALKQ